MRKIYLNLYLSNPLLRIIEPLWRNIEPHCGIIEPLWRNADHLSHCGNIESVYGVNKSFTGNHNPTLRGESACQTIVLKSFTERETVDMKAVLNDYKSSYGIIILGNCDMFDVNNDRRSNEPSIMVHRLTVRTLCKQSKIKGHMQSRSREPSRIPVKKVIQTMRKENFGKSLKGILGNQLLGHLSYISW